MKQPKLLRLDLQHFADPNTDPNDPNAGNDPNGGTDPNGAGNTDPNNGSTQDPTQKGADKTFTQAELEAIVKDRLDRAKRKADEKAEEARKEAERTALAEQGKYKEMYEALQKDLADKEVKLVEAKKETMLIEAGYTKDQVERYAKFLTGNTEEELETALTQLKEDIPPKQANNYVDPATKGNGGKVDPKQVKPYDYGKSVIERLKASGRLRK